VSRPALVVLAKAPRAGRSKTRLCPPLAPAEAAELAAAALQDTLEAVRSVADARAVIVLDGSPGPWIPPGFDGEIAAQSGGGLGDRLAGAFATAGGPALVVAMDTPQLTAPILGRALDALVATDVDAVLGPASDGGYWAIGLRAADERVFTGVPMSTPQTAAYQRARLRDLGLRVAELEELRDVDTIEDAIAVADEAPHTRFAAALASFPCVHRATAETGTG
jgi:rSAM/selenodomain-associated transferase 1